jgi:hypothetical protein
MRVSFAEFEKLLQNIGIDVKCEMKISTVMEASF